MMVQEYDKYNEEDFSVWKTLFERQMKILPELAASEYLNALSVVGMNGNEIPRFDKINELLSSATGWQVDVVPHIISNEVFFPKLANRTFGATTWLRKMSQLDYLEEPDMFHDVFGHVPLLSNETFCKFFHGLAVIALEHINDPFAIEMLGRVYWFTIEFGLISESDKLKIYGAGIMSSHGETKYSVSNAPTHLSFDVNTILDSPYDNMRIQDKYFIIDGFDQLFDSLPEIDKEIELRAKKRTRA
jgi:phenylalanine-4-hydroxylase